MIVCGGEALIDLVPNPVPGGGPMNTAIAASRLGVPTAFVGGLSTDEYGQTLRQHMERNQVDLSCVATVDAPTATAHVDPGPPVVFTFSEGVTADQELEAIDLSLLARRPKFFHVGALGLFRGRTATTLLETAEAFEGVVSVDPNVRPMLIDEREDWLARHERWMDAATVYKASDEDLSWVWGDRPHDDIVAELFERGCALVAITEGPDGATLHSPSASASAPGVSVEVVDTVGAGDTFAGTLLAGLWGGIGWPSSALDEYALAALAARAVAGSALACTRAGADPPTAEELNGFLTR